MLPKIFMLQSVTSVQQTYIKVWRIAFDAYCQVCTLDVDCKVLGTDARRDSNVYVDLCKRLIPLVDHTTVVTIGVSLAWCKSFSTHGLRNKPVI